MPQLDFSAWPPQLIWLVITFVVLYLLMARVALPRIATVLEQRRDRIASDLDDAARLKNETEQAIQSYEAALAEARSRAHQIASETREKLTAELDKDRSEVDRKIAARTEEAEQRISAMKERALGEIDKAAADTAEAIVQSLIGAKPARAKVQGAVKAALGH